MSVLPYESREKEILVRQNRQLIIAERGVSAKGTTPTTSTKKDKTAKMAVFSFLDDNAFVGGVEGGSRERE